MKEIRRLSRNLVGLRAEGGRAQLRRAFRSYQMPWSLGRCMRHDHLVFYCKPNSVVVTSGFRLAVLSSCIELWWAARSWGGFRAAAQHNRHKMPIEGRNKTPYWAPMIHTRYGDSRAARTHVILANADAVHMVHLNLPMNLLKRVEYILRLPGVETLVGGARLVECVWHRPITLSSSVFIHRVNSD